jgi:hypothetical protein
MKAANPCRYRATHDQRRHRLVRNGEMIMNTAASFVSGVLPTSCRGLHSWDDANLHDGMGSHIWSTI